MKKLLVLKVFFFAVVFGAQAQTGLKVKKTTTPVQKVHNAVHRKKNYKGYKVKRKHSNGLKTTKKTDPRTGEVEI